MTRTPISRRRAVAVLLAAAVGAPAMAQSWPEKPIRMIVGFAPGGFTDVLARMLGQKLSERLGQPVLVENKPGAAGTLGADLVAKARPDGYTLLLGHSNSNAVAPALYPKLPYDTRTTHVPYKGSGQSIVDLLAGTVDLNFESLPNVLPHLQSGGELNIILSQPDVVAKIASQGGETIGGTSKAFTDFLPRDTATWARLVKEADIRAG